MFIEKMKCLNCGKKYKPIRKTSRFCSANCRLVFHRREVSGDLKDWVRDYKLFEQGANADSTGDNRG